MSFGNTAVVFGGRSNESEISVITGTMCANVLKSGGESVLPVYISPSGMFYCGKELSDIGVFRRADELRCPRCFVADGGLQILGRHGRIKSFVPLAAAINCCHGGLGEGGGLAGLFAMAGIPLAGGDIFSGAAFLDKCLSKTVFRGLGVPVLDYAVVTSVSEVAAAISLTGLPAIIKPSRLGSSIGVARAETYEEYASAVESALCYDSRVLCEPFLKDRREINCAAYFADGRVTVSECEEAFSSGALLSFDDKYSGGGRSVIPADIPAEISDKVKDITRAVYSALNMRGIVRFDYLLDGEEVYLSEVNTVPGSLAWYLFAPSFRAFYPILKAVIAQAVADYSDTNSKLVLKTGILSSVPESGGKIK